MHRLLDCPRERKKRWETTGNFPSKRKGWRLLYGLLMLVILTGLMTGCWDRREIEARTSVVALAVDQDPAGYKVSIQVPIPLKIFGASGGGGGGGKEAVQIFSGTGKTLIEALENIQNQTNQEVFLGHTRLILIGEAVAKKGIWPLIDGLRRQPAVRRRLWPLVVKGKAQAALESDPKLEQVPAVYFVDMIENGVKNGAMADMTLGRLYQALYNPALEPYINYIEAKPNTVRWLGLALFKKDKLVGRLNPQESAVLLQAKEAKTGDPVSVPCPDGKGEIVFQPDKVKTKYQINQTNRNVRMRVRIRIDGRLTEKTCPIDLSQPGNLLQLEKAVQKWYEQMGNRVLGKTQKEWNTDVFAFGNEIRAFHPAIWKSLDWRKQYASSLIDLQYQVKIQRIGLDRE